MLEQRRHHPVRVRHQLLDIQPPNFLYPRPARLRQREPAAVDFLERQLPTHGRSGQRLDLGPVLPAQLFDTFDLRQRSIAIEDDGSEPFCCQHVLKIETEKVAGKLMPGS